MNRLLKLFCLFGLFTSSELHSFQFGPENKNSCSIATSISGIIRRDRDFNYSNFILEEFAALANDRVASRNDLFRWYLKNQGDAGRVWKMFQVSKRCVQEYVDYLAAVNKLNALHLEKRVQFGNVLRAYLPFDIRGEGAAADAAKRFGVLGLAGKGVSKEALSDVLGLMNEFLNDPLAQSSPLKELLENSDNLVKDLSKIKSELAAADKSKPKTKKRSKRKIKKSKGKKKSKINKELSAALAEMKKTSGIFGYRLTFCTHLFEAARKSDQLKLQSSADAEQSSGSSQISSAPAVVE